MKVCKQCGSHDVAKSVWFHLNAVGIHEMGEQTFYWCFNCNKDSEIIDKNLFKLQEPVVKQKVVEEKKTVVVSKVFTQAPLRHNSSSDLVYGTINRKGAYVRSWHLIKNAKKKELKGHKVEWSQQKGNKVPVWIQLKDHKAKVKTKNKAK